MLLRSNSRYFNIDNQEIADSLYIKRGDVTTNEYITLDKISSMQSDYIDTSAKIDSTSYYYSVVVKDTCGNLKDSSDPHQNMVLTGSLLTNKNVELSWNSYLGYKVINYKVFRAANNEDFQLISEVNSPTNFFIDSTALLNVLYKYYISVQTNILINTASSDYLTLNSNKINIDKSLSSNILDNEYTASDFIIISSDNKLKILHEYENLRFQIFNIKGSLFISRMLDTNTKEIDLNFLPSGIYMIRLIDKNDMVINKRLIKK